MTNDGGTILAALIWQQAIPANASRNQAFVQNTSPLGLPGYDRTGIDDGPAIYVWPFAVAPANGVLAGAILLRRPGDSIVFTGAQTQAAIYVCSPMGGAQYAATEY